MNKRIISLVLATIMILSVVLSAVVYVSAADVPSIDFDDLLGNLPGKAVVTVAATTKAGEPVTFTWGSTVNTTHCNVLIEKQNGDKWEQVELVEKATSGLSKTLDVGTYRVIVYTYNGESLYNCSDEVTFRVQGDAIRGDMNGDDVVTDADAVYLLRHTMLPGRYPLHGNQSADVNGDGLTSDADAVYLLRHTMLPSRYPLS